MDNNRSQDMERYADWEIAELEKHIQELEVVLSKKKAATPQPVKSPHPMRKVIMRGFSAYMDGFLKGFEESGAYVGEETRQFFEALAEIFKLTYGRINVGEVTIDVPDHTTFHIGITSDRIWITFTGFGEPFVLNYPNDATFKSAEILPFKKD